MKTVFQFIRKWAAIFILSIISAGLLSDNLVENTAVKTKPKKEQN